MVQEHRERVEALLNEIERDLKIEQFQMVLPNLLDLSRDSSELLTRVYCVGARCYFVARDSAGCEQILERAKAAAVDGGMTASARVTLTEASLLTTMEQFPESEEKLALVLPILDVLSDDQKALTLSLHGRNEAMTGAYAESITHSQEAISVGQGESASVAFANMTISMVFQAMGRFEESEQYALEQIRIYSARGSKHALATSYSVLATGAASHQKWDKALEYQQRAIQFIGDIPKQSAMQPVMLAWMASSEIALGKYEVALMHSIEAVTLISQFPNPANLRNARLLLGHARLKNNDPDGALADLNGVLLEEGLLADTQRIVLYQLLSETFKALDRRADAFDICYRLWELQRDFDERTREALLRYHKSLEKKIHFQEITLLKTKADSIERELSLQTMSLAAQTDMLARFRDDLRDVVRSVSDPSAAIRQVKEKLKALPCEQIDWAKFEAQFASVHPEFRKLLVLRFPDLTPQELRICQLLRVGMRSFEVGRLICISERGVESHRANIRKKLALNKEQSLADFLTELD